MGSPEGEQKDTRADEKKSIDKSNGIIASYSLPTSRLARYRS